MTQYWPNSPHLADPLPYLTGHVGTGKAIGPPYYPLRFGLLVCMERRYVDIVFGLFPSLLMPHPFYVETKAI